MHDAHHKKVAISIFLLVFNLVFFIPAIFFMQRSVNVPDDADVGIWYSTWYAKEPSILQTWSVGFGTGSDNQFLVDMNRDGKDDAAVYYAGNGSFRVAISSGTCFTDAGIWNMGAGINASARFLADVTGDGFPDAIFYHVNGTWGVGINNGTGFDQESPWITGFGSGSSTQLVGDVDGNGKADAVIIYNALGQWNVALSDGSSFHDAPPLSWIQGFGINSTRQIIADINQDGKNDAVAFVNSGGRWHVSNSNGSAFGNPQLWIDDHGQGSQRQMLSERLDLFKIYSFTEAFAYFPGDVNGDGLPGDWYAAGRGCMNTGFGAGSDMQFLGNVTGDPRGWCASVVFYAATGTWQVQPYYFIKQNIYNTWDAWHIKYLPLTLGSYQTYDSGNVSVIDEHLSMIAAAEIDFLLLDETNNLYVDEGYIFLRAKVLTSRIHEWNSNPAHRPIKYAIVIGGNQFSSDPVTLANEAGEVWSQFANTTDGGIENYYHLDGKPLLVDYCSEDQRETWFRWNGSKANAEKFTLRWAKSPAGFNDYGWEVRSGTVQGDETMIVMPGWNNNKGAEPVSRQNGAYYSLGCWEAVLAASRRPRIVVINSFNEYAEETAVAPADTRNVTGTTERWSDRSGAIDNFMYWNMTRMYINCMRSGQPSPNQMQVPVILILTYLPYLVFSIALVGIRRRNNKKTSARSSR